MKIYSLIIGLLISFFLFIPNIILGRQNNYYIGSGDILKINVWGEPDLDKDVIVAQDGKINYPLLDTVHISGLTISQVKEKIAYLLGSDYLVDPQVDVAIKEYHSQKVLVLGEIKSPGLYALTSATSLLEIISRAGGVSDNIGSQINIFQAGDHRKITSSNEDISSLIEEIKPVSIDLDELLKKGNLTYNIPVRSGDIIFFTGKKDGNILKHQVYISGNVKKPGAYDYQKGLSALNACIMAGGFEKNAAPNRTILTRNIGRQQQVFKVNLNKIKKGKKQDIQLQPGDRLYIQESFW